MMVLYTASRDGEEVFGTRTEIAKLIDVCPDYIAHLARTHTRTKSGWIVRKATNTETVHRANPPVQYIACNHAEDPILGIVEEIAPLLGCSETWVREIIKKNKTWRGWTIREATPEEIAEMEAQWA